VLEITKTLYVTSRADWRAWLAKHHTVEKEIWLIMYRKDTGQPSIPYDHAVEEALCYGWIDGLVKKMDEARYAQRFTPRKNTTNWSDVNKKRLHDLLQAGKMTPSGMAKIDPAVLQELENFNPEQKSQEPPIPEAFGEALKGQPAAWKNFESMAPSYRRQFIGWIADAKREETRTRRIQKAIELLLANKNLTQM
jgi:uncharacterized protein YdeI (YjbR/CyaY-like superfamily)